MLLVSLLFVAVINPYSFLNQVRAGLQLACTWFLKIDPVQIVSMRVHVCACVCVSVPEAINN